MRSALRFGLVAVAAIAAAMSVDAVTTTADAQNTGTVRVRKGYTIRHGGYYSYSRSDSINTYGNARTRYGNTNSYRDPMTDRQSPSGPFDHGFFFDSGMGLHAGNAPYQH